MMLRVANYGTSQSNLWLMTTLKKDQAALPQCGESAYIYALSACEASSIQSAFPVFENTPSSLDGLFGSLFCCWWGWYVSGFAQTFTDHFGNPNSSQWLHRATHEPASLSELPQASAVSSVCFWKKLIQCHCRHQTAKLKFLHFTLYFLSGGGGMRRKVLPASSCKAAVVAAVSCILFLISTAPWKIAP